MNTLTFQIHHYLQNSDSYRASLNNLEKNLHKKFTYYYQIRNRIFNENRPTKVVELRRKSKEKRELQKYIESSIINEFADDRAYAKVEINGHRILGLIDSGANITCLGKGALDFLDSAKLKLTSLTVGVQTADGSKKSMKGYCKIQIKFKEELKDIVLFVCPDLEQKLYLGVDFIKKFNLAPDLFPTALVHELNNVGEDPKKHQLSVSEQKILNDILKMFPCSNKG